MKLKIKLLTALLATITLLSPGLIFADPPVTNYSGGLTNPAIDVNLGNRIDEAESGATFLSYFITIWRALITVGALAVIIMFLWGAIEWITAGGDSAKVGKARERITQAVIGMILLVGSFVIIGFIGQVFFGDNFDILNLTLPTPS